MTYIKWIELQGFKSFNKAIRIKFNKGISVIIGPNGSGKSNIIDAICFVLGKSKKKELRTNTFRSLIFSGKNSKAKFAKVKICFDNSKKLFPVDGDLVIERIIRENGKVIYKLNGKTCSKQEVLAILSLADIKSDGYNIILQNEIARYVDMSSDEIRELIKEVANIKFYEEKVHKATLELNKVENKIKEVKIKISEKRNFLREIEKEKERAKKWESLNRLKKDIQYSLLKKEISIEERKRNEIAEKVEKMQKLIESLKIKKEKIKSEIEEIEKKIKEVSLKLKEEGEEEYEKIKKEIEITERDKVEKGLIIERIESFIKESTERVKLLKEQVKDVEKELNEIAEKINNLRKKENALKKEVDKISSTLKFTYSKIKYENIERVEKEIKILEEIFRELKRKKLLIERLGKYEEEIKNIKSLLEERRKKLNEFVKKLDEIKRKKILLEKEIERESKGVIKKLKSIATVYGFLKDLFTVSNYKEGILNLLYSKLNNIVVESFDDAIKCIEFLKNNKIGRYTFIVLERIPDCKESELLKYIVTDEKFKKLFAFLLKDYKVGKGEKYIREDGIVVSKAFITGGYFKVKLLKEIENELRETEDKERAIDEEIEKEREEIMKLKEKEGYLTITIEDLKKNLEEVERITKGKNIEGVKRKIEELKREREELFEILKKIEEEKPIAAKVDELRKRRQELITEISSLEAKKNILERDKKNLLETIRRLEKEIERESKRKEKLSNELVKIEGKLEKLKKKEKEIFERIEKLMERREKLNKRVIELNSRAYDIDIEIARNEERLNNLKIKLAEVNARVSSLKEQESEFENCNFVNLPYEELKKRLEKIRKEIESFGLVNMKAIEMYEKVSSEIRFLEERVKKLEEEKEGIEKLIEEYNQKKVSAFLDKFNELRINLQEIFSILSPKGEIDLKIVDEKNPLESDIELIARPKGKRLSSVTSLSGGEKALVAISIIFALQKFKPSPFYIFDEIDAALDKENSDRLAKFIKVNSKDKQFIIITHNDAIMAVADYIYGVSMTESGESKIVGMKL